MLVFALALITCGLIALVGLVAFLCENFIAMVCAVLAGRAAFWAGGGWPGAIVTGALVFAIASTVIRIGLVLAPIPLRFVLCAITAAPGAVITFAGRRAPYRLGPLLRLENSDCPVGSDGLRGRFGRALLALRLAARPDQAVDAAFVLEQVGEERRGEGRIIEFHRQVSTLALGDVRPGCIDFSLADQDMAGQASWLEVSGSPTIRVFWPRTLRTKVFANDLPAERLELADDRHISAPTCGDREAALNSHRRTHCSMSQVLLHQWPLPAFFPLTVSHGAPRERAILAFRQFLARQKSRHQP